MKIVVTLPSNRNLTGTIRVEDDRSKVVVGPFSVSGRASDQAASFYGNPSRSPLLRYGDTPIGGYRMSRILPTGDGTPYPANEFGRDGALVLQGTSGDAALAEANGRFQVLIQAGPLSADKRLRATNGNLRLAAVHLRSIIKAVGGKQAVSCDVIAESTAADVHVVHVDPDYDEGDPPLRPETIRTRHQAPFSRREFLRTATAAVAGVAVGGVTFLVSQQKSEAEGYISAYGEGESRIGPSLVPAVESSINPIRTYS